MAFVISILVTLEPSLADPIPVPPTPTQVVFLQIAVPIMLNYLWNLGVLGIVFYFFKIEVKAKKFLFFILILMLGGLVIDALTLILRFVGFIGWVTIVGILLFTLSFSLTKVIYGLGKQRCMALGIVYAVASHPIIGITFILPLLGKFSLIPPL
ncbi:MAG: hypothetical protein H0Z28_12550 [Archaeoglobus sp.]|nr:hypothetical protein [Archaeoglobus sp.]